MPNVERTYDHQLKRRALRVTGAHLTPDQISAIPGVAAYQYKLNCWLLYPARSRDAESVAQEVERRLGVSS